METKTFAKGYNIYKIIWTFLICSFLGAFVEIGWCYFTMGKIMSRSSLIYGQFSVVWGLGCVLLTILLHKVETKEKSEIFITGMVTGGIYEYICSLVTEYIFGVKFWDYSQIPFNIHGRINLLFCFFWGVIAVIWVDKIYPALSLFIENIPITMGKPLTAFIVLFLIFDICLSSFALIRGYERQQNMPAQSEVEEYIDQRFNDDYLFHRYQNMKLIK